MTPRLHQVAILSLAGLASLLFLHWLVMQPEPLAVAPFEVSQWVALLFQAKGTNVSPAGFAWLTMLLIAITGLVSCALAGILAIRLPGQLASRRLGWALVLASSSVAYQFFVTTHAQYRAVFGWSPDSPVRFACDVLAFSMGLMSPLLLTRFFMVYPRVLREEDITAEALRWRREVRGQASASSWRRRFYSDALRKRMANADGESHPFKLPSDAQSAQTEARLFRLLQSRGIVLALVAWALSCAVVDFIAATPAHRDDPHSSPLSMAGAVLTSMWFLAPVIAWEHISRCLAIFARNATPDDRRRIDWIKSTLVASGFLIAGAELLTFLSLPLLVRWLGNHGIWLPGQVLILAPITIPLQLATLAFVIALALSIFYRGAVDPRLMARRVSMYGVFGTLLAVLFVVLERTLALKVVDFFHLAPDTGSAFAFVGVAVTAVPLKKQADKAVNAVLGRWLPLDSMIAGERRTLVVALCDLSGYTRLSSEDEKQAMLLAALLQRQAATLTKAHGGRVVKSMGDAVMFAFEDARSALQVIEGLHREFPTAAVQLGLEPLPVHSGAHIGEVTVAHDGDIYGQTVNIAARIQGSATPGQIVVSAAVAEDTDVSRFKELGARRFKNVPEPISCLELAPGA